MIFLLSITWAPTANFKVCGSLAQLLSSLGISHSGTSLDVTPCGRERDSSLMCSALNSYTGVVVPALAVFQCYALQLPPFLAVNTEQS